MSESGTDDLIAKLARDAGPVAPLRPPIARAGLALLAIAVLFAVLIVWRGDVAGLRARYSGRDLEMIAETGAMLITGILAVCGAFALSVPTGSRRWLAAPLPTLALWAAMSGAGCYRNLIVAGAAGWGRGGHPTCLILIVAASAVLGLPLMWRLSRARPIDPAPVALLAGLGVAALSAFLLQFFHPFAVTVLDLGFHALAVAIVLAAAILLRRLALRPA